MADRKHRDSGGLEKQLLLHKHRVHALEVANRKLRTKRVKKIEDLLESIDIPLAAVLLDPVVFDAQIFLPVRKIVRGNTAVEGDPHTLLQGTKLQLTLLFHYQILLALLILF